MADPIDMRIAGIELVEAMNRVQAVANTIDTVAEYMDLEDPMRAMLLTRSEIIDEQLRLVRDNVLPTMRKACKP